MLNPKPWDERRNLVVPGDHEATVRFCVEHFVQLAKNAVQDHGAFFVALSGGSTPKAIFERLCTPPYREQIDWSKVHLFWSDERSVSPEDKDSNYHMAMESGLKNVGIPRDQIHRMQAEENLDENALAYEATIKRVLKGKPFDLIMLGMGDDGHTASLFPHTAGLHVTGHLVTANVIPQKNTARMTMTYDCINSANQIVFYVLGDGKKQMLEKVLRSPDNFDHLPSQKVGTRSHKALWIADKAAAALI